MIEDELKYHSDKAQPIKLSSEELWYLLGLYAPTSAIGVENPYIGKFVEEIKISEQFALNTLMSSQIVHLADKDSLEFTDKAIKTMVETCLKPDQCLWLVLSKGPKQKILSQRFVYFSGTQIVDLVKEGERTYCLTAVRDKEALSELLQPDLQITSDDKPARTDFSLEQSVLQAVIQAFSTGDIKTGTMLLSSAEISTQSCEELEFALGNEYTNSIAIKICNPTNADTCHMEGISFLNGKPGGWIMHQSEHNTSSFVNFQPGTAKEFQKLTFSLIN
jgi:hypothetical protein